MWHGAGTGFSSQIGTKLRDWAIRQAWGRCHPWAALSSNDSKTLYTTGILHRSLQLSLRTLKSDQILLGHSKLATYPEVVGVEDAISSYGLVQLAPRFHPVQLDQPVEVLVTREHRALSVEIP